MALEYTTISPRERRERAERGMRLQWPFDQIALTGLLSFEICADIASFRGESERVLLLIAQYEIENTSKEDRLNKFNHL